MLLLHRFHVAAACIVGILLFNMLVVKKLIGSRWLSDGTNIRHRSEWI